MMEIFHYQFMQNAAIAGVMVGVICSLLSVFIVLKRMAFIGQGIAHAAFGGVALGVLLGTHEILTATLFCIAVALLIGYTSRKGIVSEDSAIGLLLTASMALGVIFLNIRKEYSRDIMGYLFGNILLVTREDLMIILVLGIVVLVGLKLYFRRLLYFAFDEEMARVSGIRTQQIYYLLLVMIAITIVLSVKIVGIVLVSALLIVPAAAALILDLRLDAVLVLSVLFGIFSTITGLMGSYYARFSSGATIVLVLTIIFFTLFFLKKWLSRMGRVHRQQP